MPTGQANRASVLTNACLRASGASPRHSANFCAPSSKRTVRLISGVALDECLDPERYRTRVPFRTPEREAARAAQPFPFCTKALKSAGCELVEETSQGFATFKSIAVGWKANGYFSGAILVRLHDRRLHIL